MGANGIWGRFGMNRFWNKKESEAVIKHSRVYWEEFKLEHGYYSARGVTVKDVVPGVVASMKDQVQQGYSLNDVGASWGMSPERARQIIGDEMGDLREDHQMASYMIWSDKDSRFVSLSDEKYHKILVGILMTRTDKKLEERRVKKRAEIITAIQKLAKRNNPPQVLEVALACGYHVDSSAAAFACLAPYGGFRRDGKGLSHPEALDQLYLEAGLNQRVGQSGLVLRSIR